MTTYAAADVAATGQPPRVPIEQVTRAHRGHFFDADAMRFFRSRLPQDAYALPNGGYVFTTSEQHAGIDYANGRPYQHPRRYSVRVMGPDGEIVTPVGAAAGMLGLEFQQHDTNAAARKVARAYALRSWTFPLSRRGDMRRLREAGYDSAARIGAVLGLSRQYVTAHIDDA